MMRFVVITALLACFLGSGHAATSECNQDLYSTAVVENGTLIAKGETAEYNGGNVTTYIVLNDTSNGCEGPVAVGFDMRLNLTDLPSADAVRNQPPPECKNKPLSPGCPPPFDEIPLDFPGTNTTFNPFLRLGLNYNPLGHPPVGVFSLPHFDMHFYMVPNTTTQEVALGTPPDVCTEGLSPEAFYNAHMPIPQACFPNGLANINAVAPYMGNHYVNMAEPVVVAFGKGAPDPSLWQDPSFIVGGWKGKIIFLEPMVRILDLENLVKNATRKCYTPVIPAEMTNPGYYPTQFCIDTTTPGSIKVDMENFNFQATPGCNGTDYSQMSYIDAMPPPPNAPPLPAACKAPMSTKSVAPAAGPAASPGSPPTSASAVLKAKIGVVLAALISSVFAAGVV